MKMPRVLRVLIVPDFERIENYEDFLTRIGRIRFLQLLTEPESESLRVRRLAKTHTRSLAARNYSR